MFDIKGALFLFLIILKTDLIFTSPLSVEDEPTICGYESCPPIKKGKLNVHLIPHTHDDVGWLKTIDQYYYGSKPELAKAGVQYILDSVIDELLKDETKRFIYVETAFFWKWWIEQHDSKRHLVKKLVNNGQLEFIGGAWSMNDEADTHYQSTVDQFTWGLRKLNDTFGKCGRPKIGWQIDPFGHSRETASIMARLGFDGLFFGRLDYREKVVRLKDKTAEMIWRGSPDNLGKDADLFTGVLFNTYSPPPTFCFDVLCNDEPIIDNKNSPDYNADRRVNLFLKYVELQSKLYASNNLIITMGGDFTYQDAHMWYKNMDKLIRIVNKMQEENETDINLLYSTPSCYLKAVNDENISLTTKIDDFFPYASDPHSYWTGYFTSRPTIKYFERKGNNFLQICKQLAALTDIGPEYKKQIDGMRSAMGVMQHHDAVTGTEKQHVAFDYARILSNAINGCEEVTSDALSKIMVKFSPKDVNSTERLENTQPTIVAEFLVDVSNPLTLDTCSLNISQCEITENFNSFVVTLYNPLSYPVTKIVRLPIQDNVNYTILCPMKLEQPSQIVPIHPAVINIPGRFSQAIYELVFVAKNLSPLGFRSYHITKNQIANSKNKKSLFNKYKTKDKITISNNHVSVIKHKNEDLANLIINNKSVNFNQGFYYYKAALGNNEEFKNRSSGAYIFRPNGTQPFKIKNVNRIVYKGPICEEIHETYSDWVSQVIRVCKDKMYGEFNWLVGPIPINDKVGKEIISVFSTNLESQGVFYTDSNGREMLRRVRNGRSTYNLTPEEPISANYYPVTSKISINDENLQFSVLTDRAQGGSSINDGQIELMVHRRLLHDDAFGVGEALNETAFGKGLVARGTHIVTVGNLKTQSGLERMYALEQLLDVWTFLTPTPETSFDQWSIQNIMEYSGLQKALPPNVHILTLEPWIGKSILIRLEHIFEINEDEKLSEPVTVDLQKMFFPFTVVSLQETTLGANQLIKDMKRLKWNVQSNFIPNYSDSIENSGMNNSPTSGMNITLAPMQIKTFIVEVNFQ